jgi:N-acetylglucosaminyl-diphospho-decaprenol L-rhamnosyltransferase
VSYNTRELLLACLASIDAQTVLPHEVIVLDNNSADGSADAVASEHPGVRLIRSAVNLGFAAGVNEAARHASGEWLLLLNPDVVVLDAAIDRLVAFARQRPEHGLYGGRTLTPGGVVDPSSCWAAPSLWSLTAFALGLSTLLPQSRVFNPEAMPGWDRDTVREVDIVTGCLLLCRRSTWSALGGLDERYWMYAEDADLSYRARRIGLRPVIFPEAAILHASGASTSSHGRRIAMVLRGRVTYHRLLWSRPGADVAVLLLLAGVALRAAGARLSPGQAKDGAAGAAWLQAWRCRREWRHGW